MSRMLTRRSEAQANAEALSRRGATFADDHAASWRVRFDRPTHEPRSLSGYVKELRAAYQDECPSRIHQHDLDGGGTPAFTRAFEAFLWGSPFGMDAESGQFLSPLRATLHGMSRSADAKSRRRAAIVGRIVLGMSVTDAVTAERGHELDAHEVALAALRVVWRNVNSTPLPKRDAVA
jgi:hypothetical protein